MTLGGIDNADILGMSGGWQTSFTVSSPTEVVLSFRYNLTQASNYEADELSQVLVSVDGILYGEAPNDYVAQIVGNGNGGGWAGGHGHRDRGCDCPAGGRGDRGDLTGGAF